MGKNGVKLLLYFQESVSDSGKFLRLFLFLACVEGVRARFYCDGNKPRWMLKNKIHRARVTQTNVDYEGSITIDGLLMEAADIIPFEKVQVLDIENSSRLETYAREGERGQELRGGLWPQLALIGGTLVLVVGQPVLGVQVRLGEQDELQVRGPNVMLGYWNQPEATRELLDAEGWLKTGDVAHLSDSGHIRLTGRIKEIIVMSNGEKIPPTDMEIAILHDPLFDQAMVFGEAHPYLIVIGVVNAGVWPHFAEETGIRADISEALNDSRIEARVLRRIGRNLRGFPGYAKVNRVLLLRDPWTIENGLLTPTLKLRRNEVARQFAAQIAELYAKR